MYAFAVWDARREELLLARDRFGEKPLFYTEQHGELLFASELDALLAGIDREPELDPASVDAFFVFGYVPGPASIVRGVKQLPRAICCAGNVAHGAYTSTPTGTPQPLVPRTPSRRSRTWWQRPAAYSTAPCAAASSPTFRSASC